MQLNQAWGRQFWLLAIGALTAVAMLALRLADPPVVASLRGAGFDTLQQIWPRTGVPQAVRVVDIDEASLKELGQWPWPRNRLAELARSLDGLGAAAIVFDIVFAEKDRLSPASIARDAAIGAVAPLNANWPDYDKDFAAAITGKPVVLSMAASLNAPKAPAPKSGFAQTGNDALSVPMQLPGAISNIPELNEAAAGSGVITISLESDRGILREVPLLWADSEQFYPSLIVEAVRVAQQANTIIVNGSQTADPAIESLRVGDVEIPTSNQGLLQVYYRHDNPDLYVSAKDVLGPKQIETLRDKIQDHIVLIGTSATSLSDIRLTSLGEAVPGVSVHAQAIEQILSRQFLSQPESAIGAEFIFVIISGLLIAGLAGVLRPLPLFGALGLLVAVLTAATVYAFRNLGILLDFTFPLLSLVASFLATLAYKLLVTDKQGRELRHAFSHYVAPSVLDEIERNPLALKLGGEQREVTVMFVDIRNFTPLSEALQPATLVTLVNALLSSCSSAITSHRGTVDKYIGDAVMAFWNAPLPVEDHQYHAAKAALQIVDNIKNFEPDRDTVAKLKSKNLWPLGVRIGLATGPATVGNMGSRERFDYSVLGETVNTAARAESACKELNADILLAGEIIGKSRELDMVDAGQIAMKGKSGKTQVHIIKA